MKKLLKPLLWLLLVPLFILGAAVIGLNIYLENKLKPALLVELIEAEKNCRVEIKDCDVSLLSQPAQVILSGVTFAPRDSFADNATPLSERPSIEAGTTAILCPSVVLKVRLWDLVVRKLRVSEFEMQEPEVRFSLMRGGGNSLKPLFASLDSKKTPSDNGGTGGQDLLVNGDLKPKRPPEDDDKEPAKRRFHVSELPLQSTLKLAHLNGGVLKMLVEKSGALIEVKIHKLSFSDIDVNPYDLDAGNAALMNLDCTVGVSDPAQNLSYTELKLGIRGGIVPFESDTGYLNPDVRYDVVVRKGSYIQSLPFMEKLGKSNDKLTAIGLNLDELGQREVLQEDRVGRVGYRDEKIRLITEFMLPFDNYQLTLAKSSWLQTADSQHEFRGNVLVSPTLTSKALDGVETFVRAQIGEDVATVARKMVDPIVENNQISLDFRSKGEIGKPQLKIDNPLSDIKAELKKSGRQLLKDALKGVLKTGDGQ